MTGGIRITEDDGRPSFLAPDGEMDRRPREEKKERGGGGEEEAGKERREGETSRSRNVLSIPIGDLSVSDIMKKPLSSVADEVQEFLSSALTKEHFMGLIDWVEVPRPKPTLARIYCTSSEEEVAIVVSSGLRFPVRRVDFGLGRPAFGSYHFSWESSAGDVMPMPSPSGNGDWIVYMHCTKEHLEYLEEEVCDVFKPMSSHYLNLDI
ncbi:hypothetical protein Scep_013010 [Stephania cephalantha]|uniref:Uncharacterized protein n=1 Tax=Stephania cephalantha TaxID=152367 RepID=A0AAP0JGL5_9MAGN